MAKSATEMIEAPEARTRFREAVKKGFDGSQERGSQSLRQTEKRKKSITRKCGWFDYFKFLGTDTISTKFTGSFFNSSSISSRL
jgi:hypothetical protein